MAGTRLVLATITNDELLLLLTQQVTLIPVSDESYGCVTTQQLFEMLHLPLDVAAVPTTQRQDCSKLIAPAERVLTNA